LSTLYQLITHYSLSAIGMVSKESYPSSKNPSDATFKHDISPANPAHTIQYRAQQRGNNKIKQMQ